eukprot:969215-Pyramimonas_sp.AAC.1
MSHWCRCKPRCGHNDDFQRFRAHAIDAMKSAVRTRGATHPRISHIAAAFVWFIELFYFLHCHFRSARS